MFGSRRRSTPGWSAQKVPPQDGRRFVVTGGNSGVGLETARVLLDRGADVVLAVRNRRRGESAAEQLPGKAEVRVLDLSDLASVRRFAAEVGPVDVLVNNAGILGVPFSRSTDGIELQFATNHLGHFALANLMLPGIRDRIVVVASTAHRAGELALDDLDWSRRGYRPFAAYAQSKLANLLFLAELSRRLTATGSAVRATGAHPGSTVTGITAHTGSRVKTFVGDHGHRFVGMPAPMGALPTLYAATMDVPGNTFVGPDGWRELKGRPTGVGRSRAAIDPDLAAALWLKSEELCGLSPA